MFTKVFLELPQYVNCKTDYSEYVQFFIYEQFYPCQKYIPLNEEKICNYLEYLLKRDFFKEIRIIVFPGNIVEVAKEFHDLAYPIIENIDMVWLEFCQKREDFQRRYVFKIHHEDEKSIALMKRYFGEKTPCEYHRYYRIYDLTEIFDDLKKFSTRFLLASQKHEKIIGDMVVRLSYDETLEMFERIQKVKQEVKKIVNRYGYSLFLVPKISLFVL